MHIGKNSILAIGLVLIMSVPCLGFADVGGHKNKPGVITRCKDFAYQNRLPLAVVGSFIGGAFVGQVQGIARNRICATQMRRIQRLQTAVYDTPVYLLERFPYKAISTMSTWLTNKCVSRDGSFLTPMGRFLSAIRFL